MEIRKMKISELTPAEYNPRQDLQPGDVEYEKIARSIEEFGYIEPVIWNKRTSTVVGGHQRLKVLANKGYSEADVVIIDLPEKEEKILNVALNKIQGRWDVDNLSTLLTELQELGGLEVTGFEAWELEALKMQYDHIDDLLNESFSEYGENAKTTFTMTFTLPADVKFAVENYIKNTENGKAELATAIINKVKGVS